MLRKLINAQASSLIVLYSGAGEAYDKVARLLGLDLNPSGGAAVEALAREGDDQRFKFSPPLRQKPNCNFSYAGLKTAVRLAIEAEVPDPPSEANRQVGPCCNAELCLSMCPNAIYEGPLMMCIQEQPHDIAAM